MATIIASAIVPYNQDFDETASVLRDLGAKFYVRFLENAESQREIQFSKMTTDAQAFIDALVVTHTSSESEAIASLEPERVQELEETAQSEAQTVEAEIGLVELASMQ